MLDRPSDTRRDTLTRYHRACSSTLFLADLELVTKRFFTNHRIGNNSALNPPLGLIFDAHAERVAGKSSPAEADTKVKKVIEGAST
jgi:hypothetical protein